MIGPTERPSRPEDDFVNSQRKRIAEAINFALDEMVLSGIGVAQATISSPQLYGLGEEAKFRYYTPDEAWRGTGSRRPIMMEPASAVERTFLSARRRPTIVSYARFLAGTVRQFGQVKSLEALANWQVDRAVVNRLGPKDNSQPGELYRHTDPPEFKGLVAALCLDEAEATSWHSEGRSKVPFTKTLGSGSLSLYAAADLCEQLGIEQVPHSIAANQDGLSIVFLHDPEHRPFGLGSVVERLKR